VITTLSLVMEWALRSSIVISAAFLFLAIVRVKGSSIRLFVLTAALMGSLLIPLLNAFLPILPLRILKPALEPAPQISEVMSSKNEQSYGKLANVNQAGLSKSTKPETRWSFNSLAMLVYLIGVVAMFVRLFTGLVLSWCLVKRSRTVLELNAYGISYEYRVRESDDIVVPATMGVYRSSILVPNDWRKWDELKLKSVLAHELSHVRRYDPQVQIISAIHRTLLWFSPLSWFLYSRIVQLAEEASDDDAVAATGDCAGYAAVLLDFMRLNSDRVRWEGMSMARYGDAEKRIDHVLENTNFAGRVSWRALVLACAMMVPFICAAASVYPERMILPVVRAANVRRVTVEGSSANDSRGITKLEQVESSPAPRSLQQTNVRASAASMETATPGQGQETNASSAAMSQTEPVVPHTTSAGTQIDSQADDDDIDAYALVVGNEGCVVGGDAAHVQQLRSWFGDSFIWFRRDRAEFMITDKDTIDQALKALTQRRYLRKFRQEIAAMADQVKTAGPNLEIAPIAEKLEGIKSSLSEKGLKDLVQSTAYLISDFQSPDVARNLESRIGGEMALLQAELELNEWGDVYEFQRVAPRLIKAAEKRGLVKRGLAQPL